MPQEHESPTLFPQIDNNASRKRVAIAGSDVLQMPSDEVTKRFSAIIETTPYDTGPVTLPPDFDLEREVRWFEETYLIPAIQKNVVLEDEEAPDVQNQGEDSPKVDGVYRMTFGTDTTESRVKNARPVTSAQEKRLRKKMKKMARKMQEKAEAAAKRLDDAVQPVEEKKADATKLRKSEYRMVDGKLIKTDYLKEKEEKAWWYSRAKDVVNIAVPTVRKIATKLPKDIVPQPLTPLQRLTSVTTTFIAGAVALVHPFEVGDNKSAADAARPINRPPRVELEIQGNLSPLGGKQPEIIEKPFVQLRGLLEYPKSLIEKDGGKLVLLPDNPLLYRFFNKQDFGEFGYGRGETCPAQRFGQKDLIGVIHTTALAWHAAHPDVRLIIADLNADGHKSHDKSIDGDLYMEDDSIRYGSPHYKKERAIELGKILLETGKIKFIFFNDPEVIDALNAYAKDPANNLPGEVQYAENHDAHFHIRINNEPGPYSAPSCEAQKQSITIPWMNEGVMKLEPYILESSKEFGVDPDAVAIIAYIENKGRLGDDTDSWVGAVGPMQVMPSTAVTLAEELGIKNYNLRDPKTNIRLGTYYISKLLKAYGREEHGPSWDMSVFLAAIGYNGGPGAANGYLQSRILPEQGPFCESRRYGYYALGMWRQRHDAKSSFFDEYNKAINHCNDNPNSFSIPELQKMFVG